MNTSLSMAQALLKYMGTGHKEAKMPLKKMIFLAVFVASFSILVLVQNQTKKAAVLDELSPAHVELSCVPCAK